jgi:hypothetical protein
MLHFFLPHLRCGAFLAFAERLAKDVCAARDARVGLHPETGTGMALDQPCIQEVDVTQAADAFVTDRTPLSFNYSEEPEDGAPARLAPGQQQPQHSQSQRQDEHEDMKHDRPPQPKGMKESTEAELLAWLDAQSTGQARPKEASAKEQDYQEMLKAMEIQKEVRHFVIIFLFAQRHGGRKRLRLRLRQRQKVREGEKE